MSSKFVKLIAVGAGALLLLTACGGPAGPTETVTVSQYPYDDTIVPDPEPYTAEDAYIANLRSQGNIYVDSNSDADLIDLGYTACEVFADGYTLDEFVYELVISGEFETKDEQTFIGLVIGAAVRDLCPEYMYLMP